ncbi:MAG: DUF5606 domain-containing protein [Muribaculaceae bacterium]|nr:DUF5606 domain-containing protein [Muribaculaceae bacterium]
MLRRILAISGKPGLYKLISQGRGMLIVENLATHKRMPAYSHDRVSSLGDIAIYTVNEDVPLADVLDSVYKNAEGKEVEVKKMEDAQVREFFKTVLPEFDDERVYTSDIRKLLSWYNLLIADGFTKFTEDKEEQDKESQETKSEKE